MKFVHLVKIDFDWISSMTLAAPGIAETADFDCALCSSEEFETIIFVRGR